MNKDNLRILNLGAGVQSSTVLLLAERGEIAPIDHAIFADTMAEPPSVYVYLDYLMANTSIPIHIVNAGSLSNDGLEMRISKSGRRYWRSLMPWFLVTEKHTAVLPNDPNQGDFIGASGTVQETSSGKGMLIRKCTRDYKITPIRQKTRALMRGAGISQVDQIMGISLDEIQRIRVSQDDWCEFHYPLIDLGMTREDCKTWMRTSGYKEPPRSACYFCPYHSDNEWLSLKYNEPALFKDAVNYEKEAQQRAKQCEATRGTPFLHASRKPLDTVGFTAARDDPRQLSMLDECTGMCGV